MAENGLTQDINARWTRVRGVLRAEVGDSAYKSWLKPLGLVEYADGVVKLSVPTRFMRDWVANHYGERISALWSDGDSPVSNVDIFVLADKADVRAAAAAKPASETTVRATEGVRVSPERAEGDVSASLDPRFKFDNFVVGKPNELAYAAARRVADSPTATYNPLFLYGGVGLGKTHLMHAIAWHIREHQPDRKVVYLSAEKFMYHFIRALRFQDTMAFKERFRSVDVLMIDDVQFINGKESTQEEFFHTFNDLVDNNRQVVISADKSPSDLEGMEERLRSRLGWGLVADIHATTYELRLAFCMPRKTRWKLRCPTRCWNSSPTRSLQAYGNWRVL